MLQDVLARRATEIDVLNGGIAAEGRRTGVPTPLHDCMVALVKGLERSWVGLAGRHLALCPIRDIGPIDNHAAIT
jgi:2-dehydropantoate 2-reductase